MDYLQYLNELISMPEEASELIYEVYENFFTSETFYAEYQKLHDEFFAGENILDKIKELAVRFETEESLLILVFAEMLSITTKSIYKEKNISEEIFYESMLDIPIWAKVCKRDYGIWGLKEIAFNWFTMQLRTTMFRLGRLQFHIITFKYDSYNYAGYTVNKDDEIINIHIPEGDALTYDKRIDSYKKAYKFLGKNVFVCDTWLFYPKHREFLPPNSNILSFMDDFDIIDSSESDDLGNMWRIYGRRDTYIPSELPRDTGLQRAYADWLAKGGKTGSGYGIFFFDGENIIKKASG